MSTEIFDVKSDFNALAVEVSHLDQLHKCVYSDGWPSDEQSCWVFYTAMASVTEKCCWGMVNILKRLLLELDGSVPSSEDWQRQVIDRAANVGPHSRLPLIGEDLKKSLHDLLSFRNRERNFSVTPDYHLALKTAATTINSADALGERLIGFGLIDGQGPAPIV